MNEITVDPQEVVVWLAFSDGWKKASGFVVTIQGIKFSFVPYNKSYAVEVAFPEGLTTTNHKEIKYEIDLSGKAEIITSSRSILSRIFAPIYELFKEK